MPLGGPGDPVLRVTMTRASSKVAARSPEGIPDNGEHGHGPKIATVERREACVSVAGNARRLGRGACVPVMAREPGCFAAPERPSALPTPSTGVENEGARRETPRERRGKR